MTPKTILYVASADFFSGSERALLVTAQGLDQSRYRPVVALGCDGELGRQLREAGISTVPVTLARTDWRHPWAWAQSVWSLVRVARSCGADLLHVNETWSCQPVSHAGRLLRVPVVVQVRFFDNAAGVLWYLKGGFDRAVFVSSHLAEEVTKELPEVFGRRWQVLHDGVEIPDQPDQDAWREGRRRLGLPLDAPVIALIGQVAEIKGIWEFVEAARHVSQRIPDARFVVVGDDMIRGGEVRRAMEARVEEYGLSHTFQFLGYRADARALMPLFDIVAVPSHVEPLGLSALEAMAAGCPVVASRVGGLLETVVDGATGWTVPARDASALAGVLERQAGDRSALAAIGRAARAHVQASFGAEVHCRRLQAMYDDLLSKRPHA